jgi:hypothetical protein
MKRLLLVSAAVVLAGSFAVAQASQGSPAKKTAICHKTKSKTRPYVRITVATTAALRAHLKHPDDIVPAPRTCPQTLLTPTSGGVRFARTLLGVAERPEPADPDGTGTAVIRFRLGQARACFVLAVRDIRLPSAGAHIHRASVEEAGPIVIPLTSPGANGTSRGCAVADRALVRTILRTPAAFYVNVHTTDFPGGAVRAQLSLPSSARLFTAEMAGAKERPNPADPNGTGMGGFLIFPSKSTVCFTLSVRNISLPTIGAHIHRGSADVAGPVVIPLKAPDATGTSSGCVPGDSAVIAELLQNPINFYSNVHTRQFPGGAVRAQLSPVAG